MKFLKIFIITAVLAYGTFAQLTPNNNKNVKTKSLITKTSKVNAVGYTTYRSTAYCLTGKTATGVRAAYGMIAVDPRVIKLGSRVFILGLGIFYARDTGGLIKGKIVDIHMSCGNARAWGRRNIQLKVF